MFDHLLASQARLSQARLSHARLSHARLSQARLSQARLSQARLSHVSPSQMIPSAVWFSHVSGWPRSAGERILAVGPARRWPRLARPRETLVTAALASVSPEPIAARFPLASH